MPHIHSRLRRLAIIGFGALVFESSIDAASLYKCQRPDGRTSYQQTACDVTAEGGAYEIDPAEPSNRRGASSRQDVSVSGQVKQMQTQREKARRARAKAEATEDRRSRQETSQATADPAKCAMHRSEVAKWHQKVMNGYRQRSEKDYNENKLAYHQALVDRYCE